jgi:hypothetical protein
LFEGLARRGLALRVRGLPPHALPSLGRRRRNVGLGHLSREYSGGVLLRGRGCWGLV